MPLALLLLGEGDVEVEVEVATERGRPGKRPPHSPLVCLQLGQWRPRHRRQRDVVVGQVHDRAVEPVHDCRARRTTGLVVGPEHEVVDEELRATSEEVRQRGAPLVGFEAILFVDADPRQLLPLPRQRVAAPRQLFLSLEQREPRCEPLLMRAGRMVRHRRFLHGRGVLHRSLPRMVDVLCGRRLVVGHEIDLACGNRRMGVTSVAGFRWTR